MKTTKAVNNNTSNCFFAMRSIHFLDLVCQDAEVPRPSKISPLKLQGINIYIKHPALLDGLVCRLSFVRVPHLGLTLVWLWLERCHPPLACAQIPLLFLNSHQSWTPHFIPGTDRICSALFKTTVPYRGLKQKI